MCMGLMCVLSVYVLFRPWALSDTNKDDDGDDDDDDDDDEIAYFTLRWKTRASFVYRTKNMR